MSVVLNLPADLESKLAAEASRQGVSLSDYLLIIISGGGKPEPRIHTGTDLVAYWRQSGVVATRPQISDSQQHARQIRAEAERR